MPKSELYAPVALRKINSYVHDHIQGTPIYNLTEEGLTAETQKLLSQVIVDRQEAEGFVPSLRISPAHGRSFEILPTALKDKYWQDEYGNVYGSINSKGNNLLDPDVYLNENAPSGFSYFGLQESDSIVRILKASEALRCENIDTEMILGVLEPSELPYGGDLIPLPAFKNKLFQDSWDKVKEDEQELSEMPKLSKSLENSTFFITIRGMQVGERLEDLALCKTEDDIKCVLKKTFDFINMEEMLKAKNNSDYKVDLLDINNISDLKYFLLGLLPARAAGNLAKLHNLGLVHHFPTSGNISTLGSIVDLDSVRGEPLDLGDASITEADTARDIDIFISDMRKLIPIISKKLNFDFDYDQSSINSFEKIFMRTYFEEVGITENILDNIYKVKEFIPIFISNPSGLILEELFESIEKSAGKFENPNIDTEKLVDFFKKELEWEWKMNADYLTDKISSKEYNQKIQKLNKRREHPRILRNAPLTETLLIRQSLRDFKHANKEKLSDLQEKHGEANIDTIVHLYKTGEIMLGLALLKNLKLRKFEAEYYRERIKEAGWEEDIVQALPTIIDLFEAFGDVEDDQTTEYYTQLACSQQGLEYSFKDAYCNLREDFLTDFVNSSKSRLEEAFKDIPNQELDTHFRNALTDRNLPIDIWIQDEFVDFRTRSASKLIRSELSEKLEEIKAKYDKETVDALCVLLEANEFIYLDDLLLGDEMSEKAKSLTDQMIARYKYKAVSRQLRVGKKTKIS